MFRCCSTHLRTYWQMKITVSHIVMCLDHELHQICSFHVFTAVNSQLVNCSDRRSYDSQYIFNITLVALSMGLWNKLPHSFREPHPHPGLSHSHYPTQVGSTLSSPPLSPSITLFFTLDLKLSSSSSFFYLRLHRRYSLD